MKKVTTIEVTIANGRVADVDAEYANSVLAQFYAHETLTFYENGMFVKIPYHAVVSIQPKSEYKDVTPYDPYGCDDVPMNCVPVEDITTAHYALLDGYGQAVATSSATPELGDVVNVTFNGETHSFELTCSVGGAIASQCDPPTPSDYALMITPGQAIVLYHVYDLAEGDYPMSVEICSVGGGGDDGGDDGGDENCEVYNFQGYQSNTAFVVDVSTPVDLKLGLAVSMEFNGQRYEFTLLSNKNERYYSVTPAPDSYPSGVLMCQSVYDGESWDTRFYIYGTGMGEYGVRVPVQIEICEGMQ